MDELNIISQLTAQCPLNASIIKGIGDDSAVLAPEARQQLVCKDMLMDGVHFLTQEHPAEAIGRKALAVNLSDIAAMGGIPLSAYVALALPRSLCDAAFLKALYTGLGQLAERYEVAIAGGDTNIWDGPLVISVTVIGRAHAKGAVLRSGAQPGDSIWVSGPLGASYPSAHHLYFEPRLREASSLMEHCVVNSMIDLSDGLGKDLRHLASSSGLKAVIERRLIPLRKDLKQLPPERAISHALSDGEDFELCFTMPAHFHTVLSSLPQLAGCVRIGRMEAGEGFYWSDSSPVLEGGYEHGKKRI